MSTPPDVITQMILQAQAGITPPQEEGAEIDPVVQLILQAQGQRGGTEFQPFPIGMGPAFTAGVGEGLTDFLSIVGLDYEGVEPVTGGESFAKGFGHLVGLGVTFLPFSVGSGVALKGAGLAGFAERSPEAFRVAKNALAFGLQEFGSGETVEEGLKRGAMGAVLGGGMDAMLARVAFKSRMKIPAPTSEAGAGTEYLVHPDLITLYRDFNLFGTDDVTVITDKLVLLADETKAFQEAAAALRTIHAPNGMSIAEGLTDPARFTQFMNRESPWLKTYPRATNRTAGAYKQGDRWIATDGSPNTFEVLMHDTRYTSRLERVAARDPRLRETVRFLGEGKPVPLKDVIDLVITDVPGEMAPTPALFRLTQAQMEARLAQAGQAVPQGKAPPSGAMLFEFRSDTGTNEVLSLILPKGAARRELRTFKTIVHEYSHLFTSVWDDALGRRRAGNLEEVFGTSVSRGELTRELRRAQEEVVRTSIRESSTVKGDAAEALLQKAFKENSKYFDTDEELTAWLFSLMAINPTMAKKVAPRAVMLMSKRILDDSPKLTTLLSRKGNGFAEAMGLRWRQGAVSGDRKIWEVLANPRITNKQIKDWQHVGFFKGMEVRYKNKWYAVESPLSPGQAGRTHMTLKDLKRGNVFAVERSAVHRPSIPRLAENTKLLGDRLVGLLKSEQKWLGFVRQLKDGTFERGVIGLEGFARTKNFEMYYKENAGRIKEMLGNTRVSSEVGMRRAVIEDVRNQGFDGLIIEENNVILEVFPLNERAIITGERLSESVGIVADAVSVVPKQGGGELITRLIPSYRNRVTSLLRDRDVPEREIEWFLDISKRVDEMAALAETEARATKKAAEDAMETAARERVIKDNLAAGIHPNTPVGQTAADAGASNQFLVEEALDGSYIVRTMDREPVLKAATEEEAVAFMNRAGPNRGTIPLDDGSPWTTVNEQGASGPKPKGIYDNLPSDFEDTVTSYGRNKGRNFVENFRSFIGSRWMAPMHSVFKSTQTKSGFRVWDDVYEPLQKAMFGKGAWLSDTKWGALGDKTLVEFLEPLDDLVSTMLPARRRLVTLASEHMTREQVAAQGGFLSSRAANARELGIVQALDGVNLGGGKFNDQIVEYIARNNVINQAVKNGDDVINNVLPQWKAQIEAGNADAEILPLLQKLETIVRHESGLTRDEIITKLGISAEDKMMLNNVGEWMIDHVDPKKEFNLLLVARMAAAPVDDFKAFSALHKLTAKELQAVKMRNQALDAVLGEEGLSRTHLMNGNVPLVRKFSEKGLDVANDPMWAVEEMGDVVGWVGERLRTGIINPHEYHPYTSLTRHIQNIGAKKFLDEPMVKAEATLKSILAHEPRGPGGEPGPIARLTNEYMNEVKGMGHSSFETANAILQGMYGGMTGGKHLPAKTAESMTRALLGLGYAAAIPFRLALFLRNAFQMQLTAPFLGTEYFWAGMKSAAESSHLLSGSLKMEGEAATRAIAGRALDPNAFPLAMSTEVFGILPQGKTFGWVADKIGEDGAQALVKTGKQFSNVFRKGFDFYRYPDDFGRVLANEGMLLKGNAAWSKYIKAGRTDKALRTMKDELHTKWYGEVVDAEFEALARAGDQEGAVSFMGRELANKSHFRYGNANHPPGWRSMQGQLFGQFGTFPLQYVDYMMDMATTLSGKEAATFWAYHGAMNAGIIAAGTSVGLDLKTWALLPSVKYTGGPWSEFAGSVWQAMSGSDLEQRLAINNMETMIFPFEFDLSKRQFSFKNPESMLLPGSYLIGDIEDAFRQTSFMRGIMTAQGFNFIKK